MSKVYISVTCGFESISKMFQDSNFCALIEICRDGSGESGCVRRLRGARVRSIGGEKSRDRAPKRERAFSDSSGI